MHTDMHTHIYLYANIHTLIHSYEGCSESSMPHPGWKPKLYIS